MCLEEEIGWYGEKTGRLDEGKGKACWARQAYPELKMYVLIVCLAF